MILPPYCFSFELKIFRQREYFSNFAKTLGRRRRESRLRDLRADYLQPSNKITKIQSVMNCILLILAGLMEVGFTFCLGKTMTAAGQELFWWWILPRCH